MAPSSPSQGKGLIMQICDRHRENNRINTCPSCFQANLANAANAQQGQDRASGLIDIDNPYPVPNMLTELTRPSWDQYFINVAKAVAARATCPRANVGAVLVKDRRILATGYNGSLPGEDHCLEAGCITNDEGRFCTRVIHAEANVLYQCAKFGILSAGSAMYFWDSRDRDVPCNQCYPALVSAGISRIINRKFEITGVTHYVTND